MNDHPSRRRARRRGGAPWLVAAGCAVAAPVAEAAESDLPMPSLSLTITEGDGGGPWTMRVENRGDQPVRLSADPRLLSFDVESSEASGAAPPRVPPKGSRRAEPKPVRCALPGDARPGGDDGADLVLPPKRSWSATFDPLFYCFAANERRSLAVGTVLKPRFGFWSPPPKKTWRTAKAEPAPPAPPFVATTIGGGRASSLKEIEGALLTLKATYEAHGPVPSGEPRTPPPLALSIPEALDVARGSEVPATVSIANVSDRSLSLLFRPETIAFEVKGPSGAVTCGSPRAVENPIRELFTTLPPRGSAQVSVLLTSMCPSDFFALPGVYRVVPRVDTTGASGLAIRLKTWDGEIVGDKPMLLRVRSARSGAARLSPVLD